MGTNRKQQINTKNTNYISSFSIDLKLRQYASMKDGEYPVSR